MLCKQILANKERNLEELRAFMFGSWDHLHASAGNIIINAGNEMLLITAIRKETMFAKALIITW